MPGLRDLACNLDLALSATREVERGDRKYAQRGVQAAAASAAAAAAAPPFTSTTYY